MSKKTINEGWVKIVLILITLIAIGFSVFTYINSEERKEQDAMTILNQLDKIIQIQFQQNLLERQIKILKAENDSILQIAEISEHKIDSLYEAIELRDVRILNLEQKLETYEDISIIDVDDDEQLRIFLEWTQPRE